MKRNETDNQIVEAVRGGKIVLLGMYLGYKAYQRDYVSKTTGKKGTMKIAAHVLVRGNQNAAEALTLEEMLDDSADVEKYETKGVFGQQCLAFVGQIKQEQGAWKVRLEKDGLVALVATEAS